MTKPKVLLWATFNIGQNSKYHKYNANNGNDLSSCGATRQNMLLLFLEGQLLNVGSIIAKVGKLLMACMTKRCLMKEGTIACCKQDEFGFGNVVSTSGVINL